MSILNDKLFFMYNLDIKFWVYKSNLFIFVACVYDDRFPPNSKETCIRMYHFGIFRKTVLPERLAYTVKCPEPEIPPNPPRGHMQNFETFFYNTIPRRPAVCTVHKEWVSEVLALKRMELAKKQKDKTYRYRNTNYAFLY